MLLTVWLLKITQPEKPKDAEKQGEAAGHKIDEKKLAEIPIKARGLLDIDDEVFCLFLCFFVVMHLLIGYGLDS